MRVVVPRSYRRLEQIPEELALPASQIGATQPSSRGEAISVIGVTLAFFSTLMIFASLMGQGAEKR